MVYYYNYYYSKICGCLSTLKNLHIYSLASMGTYWEAANVLNCVATIDMLC